jgi:hypothetical protein
LFGPKLNNRIPVDSFLLERQHFIFISAAAAAFAILLVFAFYNPLQGLQAEPEGSEVIKVKKGEEVNITYSPQTVRRVQDLPDRNRVDIQVSSELHVDNFAGLRGEIRYSDMSVTFVRRGEVETVSADEFRSIEYRFLPDAGNRTTYSYEDVEFIAQSEESRIVVTVEPLNTAKVGDQYTIKLYLRTGTAVDFAIAEKTVEIIS